MSGRSIPSGGTGYGSPAAGWRRCLPHRLARGDGTFRAAADAHLTWQTHPDHPHLLGEVLGWYDKVAAGMERRLTVQSADLPAQAAVAAQGYALDPEAAGDAGGWVQFTARDLTDLPDPSLPEGFRFLTADDVSVPAVVAAHRAAWPTSALDEAAFEQVRRTWPYRAALHPLVAAPDGTLAASAIIWLDEATRTAEVEPVGTHHGFRRRGLGSALQRHAMRLARTAGARRMFAACRGAPAHAAARDMFHKLGFRVLTRDLPQVKRAG